MEYTRGTVDNSKNFVYPDTDVCADSVQGWLIQIKRRICGGTLFAECFPPTIYVGSLLKSKRRKMMRTKEHSKQSSSNKNKFIY